MIIEKELARLANFYAKFDEEKKAYKSQLDQSTLLKLDADFVKVLNQLLLADGPAKENILKNYRKITLYFHPDRKQYFIPEVIWLEQNLAEKNDDGICFKTLHSCCEKLTTPQKFKEVTFGDIKNREDCRKWLEKLKGKASSYTTRRFCDSLIELLDESALFYDETGKIKPEGLRVLITFMPLMFASFGAIIFADELLAIYTLYFLVLKGGQYLGLSDIAEVRQLGRVLQEISIVTATATTTIFVRLLEMTFWTSRQCYVTALQIGSSLLTPLISDSPKFRQSDKSSSESNFCKELNMASQISGEGMQFKTPELKIIAAPLEADLIRLKTQLFGDWRAGKAKRLSVEAFFFRIRVLDSGLESTENKLIAAQKELNSMKKNKDVYVIGGRTAEAIDLTENVINLLIKKDSSYIEKAIQPPLMQLIALNK